MSGKVIGMPIHIADGVNPTEGLLHAIVCKYQARSNEFGIMPSANLSRNAIRGKDTDSIYIKVAHSWNRSKYKKSYLKVFGWKWETVKKETMLSIRRVPGVVVLDSFRRDLIKAYDAKIKADPHFEYWPFTVEVDSHVERRAGSDVVLYICNSSDYLKVDGWASLPDWITPHDFCSRCDTCRCDNCLRLRPMQCRCDTDKSVEGVQQ